MADASARLLVSTGELQHSCGKPAAQGPRRDRLTDPVSVSVTDTSFNGERR
jgi:hypothetical protein